MRYSACALRVAGWCLLGKVSLIKESNRYIYSERFALMGGHIFVVMSPPQQFNSEVADEKDL